LLCIFLTPNSTAGFLVVFWNVVAAAAIVRPALERRVTRLKVEENSLAVFEGGWRKRKKVGCREFFIQTGTGKRHCRLLR
jgi:hypothetical protein